MSGSTEETPKSSELVFDRLFKQLMSLDLLPNSKISEAEVAMHFGVSRQPVRDAFNRLESLGLLKVKPQRTTEVRGFSMERIQDARFVRLAIELEVIKNACVRWNNDAAIDLESNLDLQRKAIKEGRIETFHNLDYDFHRLICVHAGHGLAFETIRRCKQQVDRLCTLSLARTDEVSDVMEDHEDIARALRGKSVKSATRLLRRHAGRLDSAIKDIRNAHSDYFE